MVAWPLASSWLLAISVDGAVCLWVVLRFLSCWTLPRSRFYRDSQTPSLIFRLILGLYQLSWDLISRGLLVGLCAHGNLIGSSLISLSGFAKSQVFSRLFRRVWKLSRVSPSFCLACRRLRTLYWLAERNERLMSRLWNLCHHRLLEACRRSRRSLYRRRAAKGLFSAGVPQSPFQWLVSRIFLAISSISGLHSHRDELQTVGSLVDKIAIMFWLRGKKYFGNFSEYFVQVLHSLANLFWNILVRILDIGNTYMSLNISPIAIFWATFNNKL